MGGRGASSGIKYRMPNYKNAEIRRNKLKNYLLNPSKSNGKAAFFNSIGYNMKNYKRLEKDIRNGIANSPAVARIENRYGHAVTAYEINIPLGINKSVIVLTAWQRDVGSKIPRFITAYPNQRRNKNDKGI